MTDGPANDPTFEFVAKLEFALAELRNIQAVVQEMLPDNRIVIGACALAIEAVNDVLAEYMH